MKKIIAHLLAVALLLTAASALADIVLIQNKVEITTQIEAFAKLYEEKTGVPVKVITAGGTTDYNTVVRSEMASGREPDIWIIEGPRGYELWKDKIADQTGAKWTQYTAEAYKADNKTVGFPVAIEGYGMAYNKDILDKAGIDPKTLTNYDAYKAAFEKLNSMKSELGIDMVVSMVAGTTTGMTWVTGLHNFNVYLTVGNERNDTTYINQVLEGKVDPERFHQYCQYVDLIFKYSDQDMLLNGTQDSQLAAFASGKAAFYHQGNWMDPSLVALNPDFEIAYAPHAFLHEDTDGILVNAPSWYVVNEDGNKDEALAFLDFMATSEEGANYMVNEAKMIPAFTNVTIEPSSPLSKSVMEWNAAGKTYDWQQYKLPDGFGMGTLGPIYELFASGAINVNEFEQMIRETIAEYGEGVSYDPAGINAFVTRCYQLILNREPDTDGLEYWADKLVSGAATAAEIINSFVNSDEFRNKNLSYGDQVEIMYQVMLNRASDESGKSYWVSMLNGGNTLAAIINGFCNSAEFKGICSGYGIIAGSVDAGELKPPKEVPVVDMEKIRAFVTRNYQVILGREPDADGLNYWVHRLASGEATAAEIINGFVNSDEFRNRNLSYGDQVEVLYQVMLDRGSDAAGKAYWVSMLNGGNPLAAVINGFCNSAEFTGICAEYGITPGSVDAGELKPPKEVPVVDMEKIRAFVTRCYQIILSRQPEQGGLNYWSEKLASGEQTAAEIINNFVNSEEFRNKYLSNGDSVEVLYQVMLNRSSDADGRAYWVSKLDNGEPFAVVINGFCGSDEFRGICAEYGITPGSVAVAAGITYAEPETDEEIIQHAEEIPETTPELENENTENIRAFVTHCYQSALLRDPGAEEVDYYTEKILSGQMTAKDVARAFAFSQEFQSKWTDSTAFVRVLYRLCLDREADADGLVYWTDKLANDETAAAVFNTLTENKEFVQVCATYGVPAGVDANAIRAQEEAAAAAETETNEAPAAPASEFTNEEKIRAFVSRFYRDAMGREADEEGLNYYTGRILNGEATPKDVAGEIILSEEFRGRMPGNEDLVRILYRVYLGREADEEGLANWAGQLDSGVTLETILNGFAGSEEFAAVVNGLK